MRSIVNGEVSQKVMKLELLGAKVNVINSRLCYINFDLGGFLVQYVYNVNHRNNYFLERTKPYPLVIDEFQEEKDVVKIIEEDVAKFRNALKSHHIELFVNIARQMNAMFAKFEDTYLNYNLPLPAVEKIMESVKEIDNDLEQLKVESKTIYPEKGIKASD